MEGERDLSGRCGTCSFFYRWHTDERGASTGECRIWKANRPDTGTCPSYKAVGASWKDWEKKNAASQKQKRVRGAASENEQEERPERIIPEEIGIDMDQREFRQVLRDVLMEELGVGEVAIADRWRGGEIVIVPGKKETQEKRVPIDALFHKIVMVRDKLRVLEQKINGSSKLTDDEKVSMQQYVTACYGTLTTFNVLFRDKEDNFIGQKGSE